MRAEVLPDVQAIQHGLGDEYAGHVDVHAFDKLASTSAWLVDERVSLDAQFESQKAHLCVTDWQQSGVGRRGKSWQTEPGNVTFSVLNRLPLPAGQLLGLSLVTGIAVADVLERLFGVDVMLKWPNDIILGDRKLGGLLTEVFALSRPSSAPIGAAAFSGAMNASDVVTGIGINMHHNDNIHSLGIGATSLKHVGIEISRTTRDALVGTLCAEVLALHACFTSQQWTPFRQAWERRDWLNGKKVSIHREQTTEHAVACGVNEQGALLVRSAGKIHPLYGGNVSIRPLV